MSATVERSNNNNVEGHVRELNERFGRLIKQLGPNNKRDWKTAVPNLRYDFEVDFAYALREIEVAPVYLQGKMFDQANGIVNKLVNKIKEAEPA